MLLKKLIKHMNESGFLITFAMLVDRIIRSLIKDGGLYFYHFYNQPLLSNSTSAKKKNSAFEFKTFDDYSEILAQLPRPLENIKSRFQQDVKCLVGIKDEKLVSCVWFAKSSFIEDEVRCTYLLPDNAVWDFDVYVIPEYRVGRLFMRTWQKAEQELNALEYYNSFSRISAFNKNSVISHEKLGAKRHSSAIFIVIGKFQLMVSSSSPFINFSFSSQDYPKINFRKCR